MSPVLKATRIGCWGSMKSVRAAVACGSSVRDWTPEYPSQSLDTSDDCSTSKICSLIKKVFYFDHLILVESSSSYRCAVRMLLPVLTPARRRH